MLRKIKSVVSRKSSVISKNLFLCILSTGLLILSFPNYNIWLFAWFGFTPLFFIIEKKSKFKAFLLFYLAGIIFWFGTIYWLIHVTLAGLIVLVLYLALYFGIFGFLISHFSLLTTHYSVLFIPSVWVLLEYLRAHLFTGFGWALLGYSQYLNLPVIQIADITAVYGVSFLVMMVNVVIYKVIVHRLKVKGKDCLLSIFFLLVSLFYGYYKLNLSPFAFCLLPIKVSVIQGNIPQELKWDPQARDSIVDKYLNLTVQAAKESPDLIIWPEAAVPGFLLNEPDNWIFYRTFNLAKELKTNLLIGTVVEEDADYFNSAILIDRGGEITKRYDKLHLVPFGEYIPLKKILPFLETIVPIGDFTAGKEYTIFKLPITNYQLPITFSVLICFEDLFPELSRRFVKEGAQFLVNITNDAWFGKTSSPFQHLGLSVFRAVENRRTLVRAANTGVSCFISPYGAIRPSVLDNSRETIFTEPQETQLVYPQDTTTFYTLYGDIFVFVCLILAMCGIILTKNGQKYQD